MNQVQRLPQLPSDFTLFYLLQFYHWVGIICTPEADLTRTLLTIRGRKLKPRSLWRICESLSPRVRYVFWALRRPFSTCFYYNLYVKSGFKSETCLCFIELPLDRIGPPVRLEVLTPPSAFVHCNHTFILQTKQYGCRITTPLLWATARRWNLQFCKH